MILTTTYVASPLSATDAKEAARNVAYAKLAMLATVVQYGESPYVPHLLLTLVLRDSVPAHRRLGMACGESYLVRSDRIALYLDLGLSGGMASECAVARDHLLEIVERRIFDLPDRKPTFEEILAKIDELEAQIV